MKKTTFLKPKHILMFNSAKVLVAIFRSLHSASELTFCNLQAISFCCTGKYISTGGYYFRHVNPDILIELDDLDNLDLVNYDKMCGETRKYYSIRQLAKKRELAQIRRKAKKDNK